MVQAMPFISPLDSKSRKDLSGAVQVHVALSLGKEVSNMSWRQLSHDSLFCNSHSNN